MKKAGGVDAPLGVKNTTNEILQKLMRMQRRGGALIRRKCLQRLENEGQRKFFARNPAGGDSLT